MDCVPHCVSFGIGDRNCVALSNTAEGQCVMQIDIYKDKQFRKFAIEQLEIMEEDYRNKRMKFTKDLIEKYVTANKDLKRKIPIDVKAGLLLLVNN